MTLVMICGRYVPASVIRSRTVCCVLDSAPGHSKIKLMRMVFVPADVIIQRSSTSWTVSHCYNVHSESNAVQIFKISDRIECSLLLITVKTAQRLSMSLTVSNCYSVYLMLCGCSKFWKPHGAAENFNTYRNNSSITSCSSTTFLLLRTR